MKREFEALKYNLILIQRFEALLKFWAAGKENEIKLLVKIFLKDSQCPYVFKKLG